MLRVCVDVLVYRCGDCKRKEKSLSTNPGTGFVCRHTACACRCGWMWMVVEGLWFLWPLWLNYDSSIEPITARKIMITMAQL